MANDNVTDAADMRLARAIRELDVEMQPSRDLWRGIERQIADYPQKNRFLGLGWMPYAVAASLILAVSAFLMSALQYQSGSPVLLTADNTLDRMEQDYLLAKNPMREEFTRVNQSLDQQTLEDLYRNLDILHRARRDIEAEVRSNPDDPRLVEMLIQIHEQELEMLKQDYAGYGRSL